MKFLEILEKFETIGSNIQAAATPEELAIFTNPESTEEDKVNSALNQRVEAGIVKGIKELTAEEKELYLALAQSFAQYTFIQGMAQNSSEQLIRAQYITNLGYAFVAYDTEAKEIAQRLSTEYDEDPVAFDAKFEKLFSENTPEPKVEEQGCHGGCTGCSGCSHNHGTVIAIDGKTETPAEAISRISGTKVPSGKELADMFADDDEDKKPVNNEDSEWDD